MQAKLGRQLAVAGSRRAVRQWEAWVSPLISSCPASFSSSTPTSSSSSSSLTYSPSAAPAAEKSSSAVANTGSEQALASAATSQPPALHEPLSKAADIVYRGPIEEDIEGGSARHAPVVGRMWSNIPAHVRDSFKAPSNVEDAPKTSAPYVLDSVMSKAKQLVATTGFAPSHWKSMADAAAPYYGGQIPLVPYKKGQTAAYHYPPVLVPRNVANRFPLDMYVDPVFQTSDAAQRIRMRGFTLFPRLQGKTTLLLCFSGQPLSGLWTGLRQWLDSVGEEFRALPKTQVYKLHAEEGWFNRRTHQLTKFHLRRQVDESEQWTTFVYRSKWKWEYEHALHLYNKELPVVLLVDPLGYIRWHAVGLPTTEATELFRALARKLANEKKNFT